jgi:glycosyltransferase involved in cell wall biosynthesis
MPLLIRITTIPASLQTLLKGQMNYMHQKGFDVIMISSAGKEVNEIIEYEGCEHISVPFTRTISPLSDLRCLILLIQIFKKYRPDIVHTHTPKAGLLGMLAAYLCGVPVRIHTVAGLPWINYKGVAKYFMIQLEKLNYFLANAIFPNSEKLLMLLRDYNIGNKKMKVIASGTTNGIDTNWFSQNNEGVKIQAKNLLTQFEVSESVSVWLFIGRIVRDKGIEDLVEAFLLIKDKFPHDQLWLVGDEESERDKVSTRIKNEIETNTSIKKWGFQNDVRPFLMAANILVFPSYREGFPNVPLQAASMECTMILSDINGCNEIIENGVSGLLVPPGNHVALYSAMHKLRNEQTLQLYFAQNALNVVKRKYEQRTVWESIYNEYMVHLEHSKVFSLNHVENLNI